MFVFINNIPHFYKILSKNTFESIPFVGGDEAVGIGTFTGGDRLGKTGHRPQIGSRAILGHPAFQVESQRAFSEDPFAIIFARQVDMGARAGAPFTGGMSDLITGFQPLPNRNTAFSPHMQVEDHPACAFISITIKVA